MNTYIRAGWTMLLLLGSAVADDTPSTVERLAQARYAEEVAGDLERAIALYKTIVAEADDQRPIAAEAQLRLGDCYLKQGNTELGRAALEGVLEKYADQEAVAERARALLAAETGAGEQAEKLSAEGWRLWNAQDYPNAETRFSEAVKADPKNANAWNGLGWSLLNQGRMLKAKTPFEQAVALEPKAAGALNGLGIIANSEGKTEEAIRYWKQAIEAFPGASAAYNGLCRTLLVLKRYDEAETYGKQWLEQVPGDADAAALLEEVVSARNSAPAAGEPAAVVPAPESNATPAARLECESRNAEGWQLWKQGKPAEAEPLFEEAVRLDPANAEAWNGLGWSRLHQGHFDAAAEAFEKALAIAPSHAGVLNGRAIVYKQQGKIEEAITLWRRAIKAAPGGTAALAGISRTLLEQGKSAEARPFLEQWLKYEPGNAEAKSLLEGTAPVKPAPGPASAKPEPGPAPVKPAPAGAPSEAKQDEESISRKVDAALAEGRFIEAVDWEMQRVLLRARENHGYKDKIGLDLLFMQYQQGKDTISANTLEALLKDTKAYLEQHRAEPEYAWRVLQLLARMETYRKRPDAAGRYLEEALAAYPETVYFAPSSQSKYQHLINERAGLLWDEAGLATAEKFLFDHVREDTKLEYVFTGWWKMQFEQRAQPAEFAAFETRLAEAISARVAALPEKAGELKGWLDEYRRNQKRATFTQQSDLRGLLDVEMQSILAMRQTNPYWKDKNALDLVYRNFAGQAALDRAGKEAALKTAREYAAEHGGDEEYGWRVHQLVAVIEQELGQGEAALASLEAALAAYPAAAYSEPAKQSKFQHLVNERAMLLWDLKGFAAAREYVLEMLRSDERFQHFHSNPWESKRRETGLTEEEWTAFMTEVAKAYASRAKRFPAQAEKAAEYMGQLQAETK